MYLDLHLLFFTDDMMNQNNKNSGSLLSESA